MERIVSMESNAGGDGACGRWQQNSRWKVLSSWSFEGKENQEFWFFVGSAQDVSQLMALFWLLSHKNWLALQLLELNKRESKWKQIGLVTRLEVCYLLNQRLCEGFDFGLSYPTAELRSVRWNSPVLFNPLKSLPKTSNFHPSNCPNCNQFSLNFQYYSTLMLRHPIHLTSSISQLTWRFQLQNLNSTLTRGVVTPPNVIYLTWHFQ